MGRAYAGILGPLAFTLVMCRGVISGSGLEATLLVACGAMFGFAVVGLIAGQLAETFVAEGVRQKFLTALEQQRQKSSGAAAK